MIERPAVERAYFLVHGEEAFQDDIDRWLCRSAGEAGHWSCGHCGQHRMARHRCGCRFRLPPMTVHDRVAP